jgi:Uma2 family endonuclease
MALAEVPRHRFTVEEYHRMGHVGLLHPDARVELIEGEIIDMSPVGRVHRAIVNRIDAGLKQALPERAIVQVQASVVLSDISEPEPDIALLRWRDDFYLGQDPGPDDILVLVEVGESSARYDRVVKAPLYARSGVPEVWLVDLPTWTIRVLTQPGPRGYADEATLGPGATLALLDLELRVSDLLGPQPPGRG